MAMLISSVIRIITMLNNTKALGSMFIGKSKAIGISIRLNMHSVLKAGSDQALIKPLIE